MSTQSAPLTMNTFNGSPAGFAACNDPQIANMHKVVAADLIIVSVTPRFTPGQISGWAAESA